MAFELGGKRLDSGTYEVRVDYLLLDHFAGGCSGLASMARTQKGWDFFRENLGLVAANRAASPLAKASWNRLFFDRDQPGSGLYDGQSKRP